MHAKKQLMKNKMVKILVVIFTLFSVRIFAQRSEKLARTDQLIAKEKYLEAIPLLNLFLKNDTLNSDAFAQRAKCFVGIGNYDNALSDLQRAIMLNDSNAVAYSTFGWLYAMTKQYDSSLVNYNKSIALDSLSAPSYNGRGALYYYFLDQNDKALDDFNRAIKLDPNSFHAYYNRGIIYRLNGLNEKAIVDYTISLKLHPKNHLAYRDRGLSYMNLRNYKKAIRDFLKAIKYNTSVNPYEKTDDNELYNDVCYCYDKLGNKRKVKKYSKKSKRFR